MDIGRLIAWIITVGLVLGTLGTLGEVTAALRINAARDTARGMISLKSFNQRLINGR